MLHPTRRTLLRTTALVVLTVAFAAGPVLGSEGVATLGSPPPEDDSGATTSAPADPMDGLLDYAECMRDQGVDMPDPGSDGGFVMEFAVEAPVDATGEVAIEDAMGPEFIAADEACSHHLGAMVSDHDPALEAELMDQMLAHAQCMREHGIDMDDPDVSGGAVTMMLDVDPFSEEYMAAEEACRDVLPFGDEMDLTEIGG